MLRAPAPHASAARAVGPCACTCEQVLHVRVHAACMRACDCQPCYRSAHWILRIRMPYTHVHKHTHTHTRVPCTCTYSMHVMHGTCTTYAMYMNTMRGLCVVCAVLIVYVTHVAYTSTAHRVSVPASCIMRCSACSYAAKRVEGWIRHDCSKHAGHLG